eukprot:3247328-Rhodomonas_salina.2
MVDHVDLCPVLVLDDSPKLVIPRIPFPFVFNTVGLPRVSIVGKEHATFKLGSSRAPQLMPSKKTFRPQMGLAESTAAPSRYSRECFMLRQIVEYAVLGMS